MITENLDIDLNRLSTNSRISYHKIPVVQKWIDHEFNPKNPPPHEP